MERQVTRMQDILFGYLKIVDEPGGFLCAADRAVHLELVNLNFLNRNGIYTSTPR